MSIDSIKEFLADPTELSVASRAYEISTSRARLLLDAGDSDAFFEHMRFARTIGKFLPITDTRNPDYRTDAVTLDI